MRDFFTASAKVKLAFGLSIVLLLLDAGRLPAQVRPDSTRRDSTRRDSTRRDSVRVVVPIPDRLRDSLRADSIRAAPATAARARTAPNVPDSIAKARDQARRDSLFAVRARDTVKAPIARWETPASFELTDRLTLSREEILSSGAENLTDLLDRVPGVTTFRSGWLAGVHVASYQGDFARVRYFIDGIELDPLQPRESGVLDLTDIPLWTLDQMVIERAAGEVRVWMRSWSTERTTPYTRADIFTGDLNTNGFRVLFARRYRSGIILQFGGQQAATQTGRVSQFSAGSTRRSAGDGNQQVINLRFGWSRGRLSADAYANASSRDRDLQSARTDFTSLPAFKGSRREVYFRLGYGDTARGFWTQGVFDLLRTRLEGSRTASTLPGALPGTLPITGTDTASADTVAGRTQQLLAVGYRARLWQLSVLDRVRPIDGTVFHAPTVRASAGTSRFGAGAYVEHNTADSTRRIDLFGRLLPLPWLAVTAAYSGRAPINDTTGTAGKTIRAEGGVRVRGTWIGGGVIRADPTSFASPVILGTGALRLFAPTTSGIIGSLRGPLYKDVRLDVGVVRWNTTQFGRPALQAHTELALISNWLRKFPKGQFGIDARLIYDLREPTVFFFGADSGGKADVRVTERTHVFTGQLQIRIQRASIFYQYRNLTGTAYEQIPGLTMPPALQMYGVRWEFFN